MQARDKLLPCVCLSVRPSQTGIERICAETAKGRSNLLGVENKWFPLTKPVAVNTVLPLLRSK